MESFAVWVPIVVAVIMGPIVVVLQKLRKEKTDQHVEGRSLLNQIGSKVDEYGYKIDEFGNKIDMYGRKIDMHLGWHDGHGDNIRKKD